MDILKIYTRLKKINGGKETDNRKDCTKIKFESDDDLPLNEPLTFYEMQYLSDLFLKKMINCIQDFF